MIKVSHTTLHAGEGRIHLEIYTHGSEIDIT